MLSQKTNFGRSIGAAVLGTHLGPTWSGQALGQAGFK